MNTPSDTLAWHSWCCLLHIPLAADRKFAASLAGSERQRQSGATGERLKEASGINVSLTVLGQVIMSLVDAQHGRRRHVPYRNSRLTFLLQACRTHIITMKYAQNVQTIKVRFMACKDLGSKAFAAT